MPTLAGDCCHVFSSEVERTFSHFFHMEFCMDAKRNNGLDVHIWFAYSEDLTKAAPMPPQAIEIRSETRVRSGQIRAWQLLTRHINRAGQTMLFGKICFLKRSLLQIVIGTGSSCGRIRRSERFSQIARISRDTLSSLSGSRFPGLSRIFPEFPRFSRNSPDFPGFSWIPYFGLPKLA